MPGSRVEATYCCDELRSVVVSTDVPLIFDAVERNLALIWASQDERDVPNYVLLRFCPFCGCSLKGD